MVAFVEDLREVAEVDRACRSEVFFPECDMVTLGDVEHTLHGHRVAATFRVDGDGFRVELLKQHPPGFVAGVVDDRQTVDAGDMLGDRREGACQVQIAAVREDDQLHDRLPKDAGRTRGSRGRLC